MNIYFSMEKCSKAGLEKLWGQRTTGEMMDLHFHVYVSLSSYKTSTLLHVLLQGFRLFLFYAPYI